MFGRDVSEKADPIHDLCIARKEGGIPMSDTTVILWFLFGGLAYFFPTLMAMLREHHAGWGQFLQILREKAAEAARVVVQVDPRGTSQRCPCGADTPKTLKDRWHCCLVCGLDVPRDQASAMEILRLGRTSAA
jgi:hypothetical protein